MEVSIRHVCFRYIYWVVWESKFMGCIHETMLPVLATSSSSSWRVAARLQRNGFTVQPWAKSFRLEKNRCVPIPILRGWRLPTVSPASPPRQNTTEKCFSTEKKTEENKDYNFFWWKKMAIPTSWLRDSKIHPEKKRLEITFRTRKMRKNKLDIHNEVHITG